MIGLEYILHIYKVKHSDLANELGIAKQNINKWIKGIKKIPVKHLLVLSSRFKIPQEYFQKQIDNTDELEIQRIKLKSELKKIKIPETIVDDVTGKEVNITSEHIDIKDMLRLSKVDYEIRKVQYLKNVEKSLDECVKNEDKDAVIAGLGNANELLESYKTFFYLVNNPRVNKNTLKDVMRAVKQSYSDTPLITDSFTKEIVNAIRKHDERYKKD